MRAFVTLYMIWLLVWFLPAHTRGRVTMGPREADARAAMIDGASANARMQSCCGTSEEAGTERSPSKSDGSPTPGDRANCAVCHWAAGLLPVIVISFDHLFRARVLLEEPVWGGQIGRSCDLGFETLPRGPPVG